MVCFCEGVIFIKLMIFNVCDYPALIRSEWHKLTLIWTVVVLRFTKLNTPWWPRNSEFYDFKYVFNKLYFRMSYIRWYRIFSPISHFSNCCTFWKFESWRFYFQLTIWKFRTKSSNKVDPSSASNSKFIFHFENFSLGFNPDHR